MSSLKTGEDSHKVLDKALGLTVLLGMFEPRTYYHSVRDFDGTVHHRVHPFGLTLPPDPSFGESRFSFVGAHASDKSVEAFCVSICPWIGHTEGNTVTKLRIISTNVYGGKSNQHFVFFEVWFGDQKAFMSGETTNFSGAGNTARQKLLAVFELLAVIYGIHIERHLISRPVDPETLYKKKSS